MCGIAGFFSPYEKKKLQGVVAAFNLMRHRGPDDEGYIVSLNGIRHFKGDDTVPGLKYLPHLETQSDAHLLLAHRRLAILDLSVHGHQPLVDESGRYAMIFNGEIFNYLELRSELEAFGHKFKTHSDSEVALEAWKFWGKKAFSKFNGMWAIAIWDELENRLLLCRDRFGVKPLYIARQNGVIYFSSEIKTLLAWPELKFSPSQSAIDDYLSSCMLNHEVGTFWEGIEELPPSSWLEIDSTGRERGQIFWSINPGEVDYEPGEAEEKFSEIFEDSLRLRMRSDVEVGALLSGGLDSNTILAGLHNCNLIVPNKFKSFSAIFDNEKYSEKSYIEKSLKSFPIDPYYVLPSPYKLQDDFKRILYFIEEPFRSLAVYSQYKIYEQIKRETKVKVVLNGQGADEMFGGYSSHYFYLFSQLINQKQYVKAFNEMRLYVRGRNSSFLNTLKQLINVKKQAKSTNCFSEELFSQVNGSPLREYLKYDDRNSMSASIEARTPFLDYRLVEFAFTLASEYKIYNFENKKIIRAYARKIVAPEIVNRKDKMGFVSPQEIWQKQELAPWFDQTFERVRLHTTFFDGPAAASLYQKYRQGKFNRWDLIWRYFCLMHWMEQHNIG